MVRASDKVQEKLQLCGIFFGKMEMRFYFFHLLVIVS